MKESSSEFQTIKLPAMALADMFGASLVVLPEEFPEQESKPAIQAPVPAKEPFFTPPAAAVLTVEVPPIPQEKPATLTGPPHAVLGGFKKQVLVVVHDEQAVHCNDESLAFLTKVISAVGLSLDHIAILNTRGKAVNYPELKAQLPAKVALYFGVEPISLGVPMRFPHFQVQPWDSCSFLFVPSLSDLNGNSPAQVELKKQLWIALKKIFS